MASTLLARKGRHLQRYEDHLRLVAGCIPYKLNAQADCQSGDLMDKVQVLMITSPGRQDLIFPKGGWEQDETAREAACREALEEAGVRGVIIGNELGCWVFSSKIPKNTLSREGSCKGFMFALEVTEELDHWPEQNVHERKWVTISDAVTLCRYDWMRDALDKFKKQLLTLAAPSVLELEEPSSFFNVNSAAPDHAIALY